MTKTFNAFRNML